MAQLRPIDLSAAAILEENSSKKCKLPVVKLQESSNDMMPLSNINANVISLQQVENDVISKEHLSDCIQSKVFFGSWLCDPKPFHKKFASAAPFEHVVITDFFADDVLNALATEFPDPMASTPKWHSYDNPLEKKFALDNLASLPVASSVFAALQSETFVSVIRSITGICDLESDPYLHGAGLHAYPSGGKLDMHLDYSIHPRSGKERRVNLIIYLNQDWKPEYGGSLILKDDLKAPGAKILAPLNNTAVLFRTCDVSYHGLPAPLKCPPGEYRKSMAIYYVSPPRPEAVVRYKAEFYPLPEQPVSDKLARLYNIRVNRRIENADMDDWPMWRQDGNGYW